MGKNNEDKQDAKGGGGNHEKVDGDQVLDMIVQEGAPCLGRRVSFLRHQPCHSPFRDLDPEFEQFPVDSRTSPGRVRIGHFADEIAYFVACFRPTGSVMLREMGPKERKSFLMPNVFSADGILAKDTPGNLIRYRALAG